MVETKPVVPASVWGLPVNKSSAPTFCRLRSAQKLKPGGDQYHRHARPHRAEPGHLIHRLNFLDEHRLFVGAG